MPSVRVTDQVVGPGSGTVGQHLTAFEALTAGLNSPINEWWLVVVKNKPLKPQKVVVKTVKNLTRFFAASFKE
uniref:Uncharacterized protein n=1 Tax=Romanomermis culicivorax TaxID=13658 RepID=A0A915IPR8_ROMCU